MNINIPCPKCKGYTFENDGVTECKTCLGFGDFADGIAMHIKLANDEGCKYDNPIVQAVARYLIIHTR